MKSIRILFLAFVVSIIVSCKPSPAVELTQDFTGTRWQLRSLSLVYGYEIEERYTKTENNYLYVNQNGTISIDYTLFENEGMWRVASYYERDRETQLGQEPTEKVSFDSTLNIKGIWRFGVQGGIPDEVFQQYYETIPTCNRILNLVSDWSVEDSEDFSDPENRNPIVRFQLAHLGDPDFAGDLVFYPTIFDRDGFIDVVAEAIPTESFGQDVLLLKPTYNSEDFELRSITFEDNAYGTVVVEEKLRTFYIEAIFDKVEDDPC
ncbi:MAG: hypothetical protein AAFN10_07885 [Bacteroidota bacterium]